MAGVSFQAISKSFGDNAILKKIDIQAHSGEFMVIVGPSGCGKSTLLRIIAGLEISDGGDVIIDGERKNDTDPSKREVAMVFQNYALYPTMTVYDNLAFTITRYNTTGDIQGGWLPDKNTWFGLKYRGNF